MLKIDKEEPVENLVTWVFEEGTFVPEAKITEEGTYPIISDYLGTPVLAFDGDGNQVWERELDIYGNPRIGDNTFCPFLYQGQYYDEETGLAYNRFRYYNPETGLYISKDPLDIRGGMPNNYSYVANSRIQIDPFGLMAKPSSFFTDSGGLTLKVKNQQDLSHMSDSQLRYMSENGVAGTTMGGNRGRQTIVLHHQGQQNGGPIIEMPKSTHRNINKKQHPHFPNPHPTDKVDRLRFDDWKKEYWKDRANKEMEKRKGKVKCKL
ncbi:MAG: RHS repeat-associated core domain-containing protein, partial [Bacteroidota bacterium]